MTHGFLILLPFLIAPDTGFKQISTKFYVVKDLIIIHRLYTNMATLNTKQTIQFCFQNGQFHHGKLKLITEPPGFSLFPETETAINCFPLHI